MSRIIATLGILFLSLSAFATDLQLTLSYFGAVPTTNRNVTCQSLSPFMGNINWGSSDSNGMCVFSNLNSGTYILVIKAPPAQIPFGVKILSTDSGLIDATNRLVPTDGATYPSGDRAWSIATSDQRYQLSGTTLSNTFYPLFSNPSNYATLQQATNAANAATNGFGNIVSLNTNQVDLAGAATNAANQATNTAGIIRSDVFGVTTNLLNTNLLAQISASNAVALASATNNSTVERNALIATNTLIHYDIGASNTAAINVATNDAWQSFTNAALAGAFGFNLYSSTNLPWGGITGVGDLPQWLGIGTNAWNQGMTNWTVAYVAGLGYASTGQLSFGTNQISTNLLNLMVLLNGAGTNATATNASAYTDSKAAGLTNLISTTSNLLAGAQSAGTNAIQTFVINFYSTLAQYGFGTNQISTNLLTQLGIQFNNATNYANTNASSLALTQGTAGSNYALGLSLSVSNNASTNSSALAAANSNYTAGISAVVTNAVSYAKAIAAGSRFSVVVWGSPGTANILGTNVYQSSTSWTNLNGLSFVTNDAAGSRIYVSGIPAYGSSSGFPVGGGWTNLSGSSPQPSTYFLSTAVGGTGSTNFPVNATNLYGGPVLATALFGGSTAGYVLTATNSSGGWAWSNAPSGGATNSGASLLQVTNIAQAVYSNNPAGYVNSSITNGLGGLSVNTNTFVWPTAANVLQSTNLTAYALLQVTNIAQFVASTSTNGSNTNTFFYSATNLFVNNIQLKYTNNGSTPAGVFGNGYFIVATTNQSLTPFGAFDPVTDNHAPPFLTFLRNYDNSPLLALDAEGELTVSAEFFIGNSPASFGGGATNAIANNNGFGTNTTIGYLMASYYVGNSIVLTGTNNFFSGSITNLQDNNTNDFTSFSGSGASGNIINLWTNRVHPTWNVIQFTNPNSPNYFWFRTNNSSYFSPYFASTAYTPIGDWGPVSGSTGTMTGSTLIVSTNFTFITIISNSVFTPLTFQYSMPVLGNTTYYYSQTFQHNFGHVPSRIDWRWRCTHDDPVGILAGDTFPLAGSYGSDFHYGANSTRCWILNASGYGLPRVGDEANCAFPVNPSTTNFNTGSFNVVPPISLTNFVIELLISP